MSFDDQRDDFPILMDYFENENPQLVADLEELYHLLAGGAKMTETSLYGQFSDDHMSCYNVSVTVNGKEFKFCMMYIVDATLIFHLARAPYSDTAQAEVVGYINDYLKEAIEAKEQE